MTTLTTLRSSFEACFTHNIQAKSRASHHSCANLCEQKRFWAACEQANLVNPKHTEFMSSVSLNSQWVTQWEARRSMKLQCRMVLHLPHQQWPRTYGKILLARGSRQWVSVLLRYQAHAKRNAKYSIIGSLCRRLHQPSPFQHNQTINWHRHRR